MPLKLVSDFLLVDNDDRLLDEINSPILFGELVEVADEIPLFNEEWMPFLTDQDDVLFLTDDLVMVISGDFPPGSGSATTHWRPAPADRTLMPRYGIPEAYLPKVEEPEEDEAPAPEPEPEPEPEVILPPLVARTLSSERTPQAEQLMKKIMAQRTMKALARQGRAEKAAKRAEIQARRARLLAAAEAYVKRTAGDE